MNRQPLTLGVVVALLAAGVAVGRPAAPAPVERRESERRPVVGSVAVCPELLKAGGDVSTQLTLGTAVAGEVNVRAATLVPGGSAGPEVLARGGEVDTYRVRSDQSLAVAATATGEQSGALEVEQVSRGVDGLQRGLAGVRCEPPSQETWFVGGATTVGVETQLVLVNPYDDQALVDVELYGQGGAIEAPALQGIVLGSRRRIVLPLANSAPDERGLAVRVIAREGGVSPAIRDARAAVDVPRGVDWVPRAGRPSESLTIPGVPAGNGRRLLYLFAPGEDSVDVEVTATFENERIVPAGLEELHIEPGRVALVDITGAMETRAAALRLDAQGGPILASVLVENRARFNPIQEFAYATAARPLDGPALVTDARVRLDVVDTSILLHAPDQPARVRIQLTPLARTTNRLPPPRDVTLPAGRLVIVKLSSREYAVPGPGAQRPFTVTPLDENVVYASRLLSEVGARGPLFTVLELASQPTSGVPVPPVVVDATVSLLEPRREEDLEPGAP